LEKWSWLAILWLFSSRPTPAQDFRLGGTLETNKSVGRLDAEWVKQKLQYPVANIKYCECFDVHDRMD